ncbi:MAG TPA: CotH kinase family protein [Vicinamibacterales bacterium]
MRVPETGRRTSIVLIALALAAVAGAGLLVELRNPFPALAFALQRAPGRLPSSTAIPADVVASRLPVVSLYVAPADLHDPRHGLLANPLGRGADWERQGFVSYFDRGALQFGAPVGVRIHGGKSREHSPMQSFRLYFRRRYGARQFGRDLLFDGRRDPLRRLVLHNDLREDLNGRWWHFVNPLAYDIARRLGAITPDTQPALVYLNGERQGAYVLTEHINSPGFLESRFGHANFTVADGRMTEQLLRQVRALRPLTADALADRIDIDNLTTWFIAMLYCATTDAFQGLMLRDDTSETPRWFWVVWDMDHSFMDLYRRAPVSWQHDTFRTLLRQPEVRSEIVTRLLAEDPDYARRFKSRLAEALNHQLTPAFLLERFEHYARLAQLLRVRDQSYLPVLHEFLRNRTAWLFERAATALPDGASYACEVRAPDGVTLRVDGHDVGASFAGRCFAGTSIRVEALPRGDVVIRGWRVNGQTTASGTSTLEVPVSGPVRIEPIAAPAS